MLRCHRYDGTVAHRTQTGIGTSNSQNTFDRVMAKSKDSQMEVSEEERERRASSVRIIEYATGIFGPPKEPDDITLVPKETASQFSRHRSTNSRFPPSFAVRQAAQHTRQTQREREVILERYVFAPQRRTGSKGDHSHKTRQISGYDMPSGARPTSTTASTGRHRPTNQDEADLRMLSHTASERAGGGGDGRAQLASGMIATQLTPRATDLQRSALAGGSGRSWGVGGTGTGVSTAAEASVQNQETGQRGNFTELSTVGESVGKAGVHAQDAHGQPTCQGTGSIMMLHTQHTYQDTGSMMIPHGRGYDYSENFATRETSWRNDGSWAQQHDPHGEPGVHSPGEELGSVDPALLQIMRRTQAKAEAEAEAEAAAAAAPQRRLTKGEQARQERDENARDYEFQMYLRNQEKMRNRAKVLSKLRHRLVVQVWCAWLETHYELSCHVLYRIYLCEYMRKIFTSARCCALY